MLNIILILLSISIILILLKIKDLKDDIKFVNYRIDNVHKEIENINNTIHMIRMRMIN